LVYAHVLLPYIISRLELTERKGNGSLNRMENNETKPWKETDGVMSEVLYRERRKWWAEKDQT